MHLTWNTAVFAGVGTGSTIVPQEQFCALNVEHRGVCRGGDRLHGSTAGAVLCIERGTPRCLQGWNRLHGSTAGAVLFFVVTPPR